MEEGGIYAIPVFLRPETATTVSEAAPVRMLPEISSASPEQSVL
jgi:hypothetical protein